MKKVRLGQGTEEYVGCKQTEGKWAMGNGIQTELL